jgi:hypothetical protein
MSLPSAVLNVPELIMPPARSASNYVVTLARIQRAGVGNAKAALPVIVSLPRRYLTPELKSHILGPQSQDASDCVVASKSISDTCIEYLLHPRQGDNIILVSKRYI